MPREALPLSRPPGPGTRPGSAGGGPTRRAASTCPMCLLPVAVRAIVGRTDAVRSTGSFARSCRGRGDPHHGRRSQAQAGQEPVAVAGVHHRGGRHVTESLLLGPGHRGLDQDAADTAPAQLGYDAQVARVHRTLGGHRADGADAQVDRAGELAGTARPPRSGCRRRPARGGSPARPPPGPRPPRVGRRENSAQRACSWGASSTRTERTETADLLTHSSGKSHGPDGAASHNAPPRHRSVTLRPQVRRRHRRSMFPGIGTVVNVAAVLLGATLGVLLGNRLPQRTRELVTDALGLVTLLIAATSAMAVLDPGLSALRRFLGAHADRARRPAGRRHHRLAAAHRGRRGGLRRAGCSSACRARAAPRVGTGSSRGSSPRR